MSAPDIGGADCMASVLIPFFHLLDWTLDQEFTFMILRNPGIIWTKVEGNVVMLSIELARYYEANTVGSLIWDLLDKPCTVDEIVEQVVARYRVEHEQCRTDVLKFLDTLEQRGLLAGNKTVPGAAASA
jgi:hypothetical protein